MLSQMGGEQRPGEAYVIMVAGSHPLLAGGSRQFAPRDRRLESRELEIVVGAELSYQLPS